MRFRNKALRQASIFSFFYIPLLIVYYNTLFDLPRSDHVILFNIFNNISGGWSGLYKIISVEFFGDRRFQPLTFLLQYAEIKVFGDRFVLYHLFNLALHALNGLLLYNILLRIYRNVSAVLLSVAIFLFAFTHFDILSWPFHFYVILQITLVLGSVLALLTDTRGTVRTYAAYGLIFIQLYLYEPGVIFPALLFCLDLLLNMRRERFRRRLIRSLFIVSGVYIVYFVSMIGFFSLYDASFTGYRKSWKGLFLPGNILHALFGTLVLYYDTGFLHNILPTVRLICDELVFFLPVRFTHNMVRAYLSFTGGTISLFFFLILLLAPILRAAEKRSTRREAAFLILLFVGGFFSTAVILIGRPISYSMSQSRYAYVPVLVIVLLMLHLLKPFFDVEGNGKVRGGIRGKVSSAIFGVFLFLVAMNIYKVSVGTRMVMSYREHTNDIYYAALNFVDAKEHKGDKLFIAASTFPEHENLAWGSDIIPQLFLKDKQGITDDLTKATHMLLNSSTIVPVEKGLPGAGRGQFAISFGLWFGNDALPVPIKIFGSPEDSGKKDGKRHWFVNVDFAKESYFLRRLNFGITRLTFGFYRNGKKQVVFVSKPFLTKAEEMNAVTLGRDRGVFFLLLNRHLVQKTPDDTNLDFENLDLPLGPVYRMEYHQPIYAARTLIRKGYVPWSVKEAPLKTVFEDIPYEKRGFRGYSSTLRY